MTTNQQNNEEFESHILRFITVFLDDPKKAEYLCANILPEFKQFIRSTRQSAAKEAREEVLMEVISCLKEPPIGYLIMSGKVLEENAVGFKQGRDWSLEKIKQLTTK